LAKFLDERIEWNNLILRRVLEGTTSIFVPDPDHYLPKKSAYLPAALPVFYNPVMEINRDISLSAILAYYRLYPKDNITYIEALAGTGIRGFRIANELAANINILLNDIEPRAYKLMNFNKESTEKFKNIKIFNNDANYLLYHLRNQREILDIIEIDPYGSPAPFLSAGLANVKNGGLLLITATDTAPLAGKFPEACLRKYGSYITKNPFYREIAIRALLYSIGCIASKFSRSIIPLFGFFLHHFIKVGVIVEKGKLKANNFWQEIGWIAYDRESLQFDMLYGIRPNISKNLRTPKLKFLGPLWLGKIFNETFCDEMIRSLNALEINSKNRLLLLKIIDWELGCNNIPLYYNLQEISRKLHTSSPASDEIVEVLRALGFCACRTHFDRKAIKTNADPEVIKNLIVQMKS